MVYLYILTLMSIGGVFALNFYKLLGSIISLLLTIVILVIVFSAPGGSPFLGPGMIAIITGHACIGGTTASLVYFWHKAAKNQRRFKLILSGVSLGILINFFILYGVALPYLHFLTLIAVISIGVLMGVLASWVLPRRMWEPNHDSHL